MKVFKRIIKSLSLLLTGAVLLTACQKDFNINKTEGAYLVFGSTNVRSAVKAKFTLDEFETYKLYGITQAELTAAVSPVGPAPAVDPEDVPETYEEILVAEGFHLLGSWDSPEDMEAAYLALPSLGKWYFGLVAEKGKTYFGDEVQLSITSGTNSIDFELHPMEYSTEGKGNVKISVLIKDCAYSVSSNSDGVYNVVLPDYTVKTTCSSTSLEKDLTVSLRPELNNLGSVKTESELYGTFTGTQTFTGNFIATLDVEDVPSGSYIVTFHLNSGASKDVKKQSTLVVVTDGKTSEDTAAFIYTAAELETEVSKGIYSIDWNFNGGMIISGTSTPGFYDVRNPSVITLPTSQQITKTGYTFVGWYTTSTFDTGSDISVINNNGTIGKDIALYACWTPTIYYITYDVGAGTMPASYPTAYTIEVNDFNLPEPTASTTGYEFKYWSTEGGAHIVSVEKGSYGDLALTANYGPIAYKVTYNRNGHGTLPADRMLEFNLGDPEYTLPTLTETGYDFGGWYTDAALTSSITSIDTSVAASVSVYAKWTPTEYSITYNADEGTFATTPDASYTIESATYTLPIPTKADNDFVGWYTTSTFAAGSAITEIAAGSTGDVEVYAKWASQAYTITYHVNGGTMPATYATKFSGLVEVELPEPTLSNYNFAGWYTTETFDSDTKASTITVGTNSNVELWALFELAPAEWVWVSDTSYGFSNTGNVWTSTNHTDSTTSKTTWTITLLQDAEISIPWSVSSESGYDMFNISIDDTLEWGKVNSTSKDGQSGTASGTLTKNLTAGTHTLIATYSKDSSSSIGTDEATLTLNPVEY